jgi:deoxyadenosine/deoxycytidine kinase
MAHPYVIVAGPIGAGKSTFSTKVAHELDLNLFLEPAADGENGNPFLERFYDQASRQRWAFASQVFFVTEAIRQQHQIAMLERGSIQDRSTFEHLGVFAAELERQGSLDPQEAAQLRRLVDAAISSLPKPDLLVYLQASPTFLADRIRERGRDYEIAMLDTNPQYLLDHCAAYDPWIEQFDACPVLKLRPSEIADWSGYDLAALVMDELTTLNRRKLIEV